MQYAKLVNMQLLKGHFDETLGADFLFSETAFLEMHTSKISAQNIE